MYCFICNPPQAARDDPYVKPQLAFEGFVGREVASLLGGAVSPQARRSMPSSVNGLTPGGAAI